GGHGLDHARGGGDVADARVDELAGGVLDRGEVQVVDERERGVDVGDRAGRVGDDACDPGGAVGTHAGPPRDGLARPDLGLPGRADRGQVIGEVVGRARVAGPVDRGDLEGGKVGLRVQGLDRRVVPARDLTHVDLGEDVAGEVQVHRGGRRRDPGDVV